MRLSIEMLVEGLSLAWGWWKSREERAKARRLERRRAAFAGELGEKAFVEATGGTERCPHCDTWTWQVGGWAKVEPDPDDACLDRMTCKHCNKTSRWLYGPGLFLLIDPKPESLPKVSTPEPRE